MTKKVTIIVTAPIECTYEQFEEWIKFCTGYQATMSADNPLHEYSMESDEIEINP